jgi:hypothetical protein
MNLIIKTSFISALVLVSSTAFAFGLPSLDAKKDDAPAVDSFAAQDALVQQYTKSAVNIAGAQVMFASALGLKQESASMTEQANALKSGSIDKDAMERMSETSGATNDAILAATENSEELSADAKAEFAKAFIPYSVGLIEASKISGAATTFIDGVKNTISSASMMDKLGVTKKLSAGMYVAKEMPGFASNLYSSSKTLISFAKSQGIEIPENVMSEIKFD